MQAKAGRKPTWSISRPLTNGPNALEAECPRAYQPKLRRRCSGDLPVASTPTVCWPATDMALKPKPIKTAMTNSEGTVSSSTGTQAPISTSVTPARITGWAPKRSIQRPTDMAASAGSTENMAMNRPTTSSGEPTLSA